MEILYTGGVAMAQVSIQFSLGEELDRHDEKKLKKTLDEFPGVKSVSLQLDKALLCIDYDDTGVTQVELVKRLKDCGYHPEFIDKITF